MPLYEYQCQSCDETVELLVRLSEQPAAPAESPCPGCGGHDLQRLMSVPSAPAISAGRRLPVAAGPESCEAPRCCGGGCQI